MLFLAILPVEDIWLKLLLVPVILIGTYLGINNFENIVKGSLWSYFFFQLIHVVFAIDRVAPGDFKAPMLAIGLGTLTSLYLLIKDFKYFWSYPFFRGILLYFAVSLCYLLCYGTEFNQATASTGYPVDFLTDSSDTGARSIVFLSSYAVLLATIGGLSVFKDLNTLAKIKSRLHLLARTFAFSGLGFFLILVLVRFDKVIPGHGNIIGLFVMLLLGMVFWSLHSNTPETQERSFWKKPAMVILITMPLALLSLLLGFNKSSLAGYSLSLGLFLLLNQWFVPGVDIPGRLYRTFKSWEAKLLIILALSGVVIGAELLGVLTMLADKLEYFSKGFSSMSTMRVREGNWHYFIIDWLETLSPIKALFGYGLGQSRETMFYISAMRQGAERNLVGTVHNNYIELFYDYGLLALLIYSGTILIMIDNVKKILNPKTPRTIKIFSILSVSCILYISIYSLTDGARIHMLMVYYSILAMVEGLKHAVSRISPAEAEVF